MLLTNRFSKITSQPMISFCLLKSGLRKREIFLNSINVHLTSIIGFAFCSTFTYFYKSIFLIFHFLSWFFFPHTILCHFSCDLFIAYTQKKTISKEYPVFFPLRTFFFIHETGIKLLYLFSFISLWSIHHCIYTLLTFLFYGSKRGEDKNYRMGFQTVIMFLLPYIA